MLFSRLKYNWSHSRETLTLMWPQIRRFRWISVLSRIDIDSRQVLSLTCTLARHYSVLVEKKSISTILFSNPHLSAKYVEPFIFKFNSLNAYYILSILQSALIYKQNNAGCQYIFSRSTMIVGLWHRVTLCKNWNSFPNSFPL